MSSARSSFAILPTLLLALACQTSAGCDRTPHRSATIDADLAWAHLEAQVALGPRPSGSSEIERCRQYLEAQLTAAGLTPKREAFREATPTGEIEFVNVWAEVPGTDPREGWIVIGTHYDTKRMPFPFVGANDGASSTAVTLELAREIAKARKSPFTYRFVFFDGEEAVRRDWIDPDNTYGSRYHAHNLKLRGDHSKVRAFVLLDMIGDKDLKLTRDTNSDQAFLETFFDAAKKLGLGAHVDGRAQDVRDDHQSFKAIGIRSVDLIDLEYGPNNSYWHTAEDVPANCSKESLERVGRIALAGLAALEEMLRIGGG